MADIFGTEGDDLYAGTEDLDLLFASRGLGLA
jgi:hypothetical protein